MDLLLHVFDLALHVAVSVLRHVYLPSDDVFMLVFLYQQISVLQLQVDQVLAEDVVVSDFGLQSVDLKVELVDDGILWPFEILVVLVVLPAISHSVETYPCHF